jgi:hypothetical protein
MNAYQSYAKGKALVKEGNGLINESKPKVTGFVQQSKDGKVVNDFGRFQLVSQPRYKYSSKVESLEAKLKIAKRKEEEDGTAKPIPTQVLRYYFK